MRKSLKKSLLKIKAVSLLFLKGLSGLALAYVLALIGKEFIRYGLFAFLFIVISVTMAFLYLVKDLKFPGVILVDGILVMVALFFRLYVHLAAEE